MNSFVSNNFYQKNWYEPSVLFPFGEGFDNLQKAYASGQNRFTHLAIGVSLCIPLVQTIVSLAIKIFSRAPIVPRNAYDVYLDWHEDYVTHLNNGGERCHSLAELFQQTLECFIRGSYPIKSETITLDPAETQKMIEGTVLYQPAALEAPKEDASTYIEVVEEDTFDLARRYRNYGLNPVGLNMANPTNPGGGVVHGAIAQEECLCRRSDYYLALERCKEENPYYLEKGLGYVIYTPNITVIRSREADWKKENYLSYKYEQPYRVSMIACAALYLIKDDPLPGAYEVITKEKIRSILRAAADKGHDSLALGALGCGAFNNPADKVALYFKEVFEEAEFKGRFKKVGFGILYDERLLNTFKSILTASGH